MIQTAELLETDVIEWDDSIIEMIDHEPINEEMNVAHHSEVIANLSRLIGNHVKMNELGKVYTEGNVIFEPKVNLPRPDLCFVSLAKLPSVRKYIETAPDLIVEVVSDTSFVRDTETKRALYERFGVPEYWIVFPSLETLHIFVLTEGSYRQHCVAWQGSAVSSVVLPTFSPPVAEIFG